MKRKVYLEDVPLPDAMSRFFAALDLSSLPGERVPFEDALGRITAGAVWARISSPHYHAAAMDGVAVRADDTLGAKETSPIRLKLGRQAHWVDTGDAMPSDCNAVVMVEDLQQVGDDLVEIIAPVAPWQHVRPMGEDIVATELVVQENQALRPVDLAAIAAAGHTHVDVRRRPRVAIIPTGSELVRPGAPLKPGDIIEFNSLTMAGLVQQWGGSPVRMPIVADDLDQIKRALQEALADCDVVLINAGSSAGSEDYTSTTIQQLGRLIVHGIAIRPGHPVALGLVGGKPVVGVPGYPVSAALTCELIVRPLVARLLGRPVPEPQRARATITRKLLSHMGLDEFVRVKLGKVGDRLIATPLPRGAGAIMSLARADGILTIPRFSEGVHSGDEVSVDLLRPLHEIERTIVAIGSHDMTLDLIANRLSKEHPGLSLSSSNVGSLGGLMALKNGEAHLAGCHLLDEETGDYNLSYVRKLLPGRKVALLNLVYREQGLMVQNGNPKGIKGLEDLLRRDVLFINRQRGSGTRVLLDYELKRRGLSPDGIRGYDREEFTHLAVASAVASGAADAGLGILAAARALGLDFVPLLKERYDLAIPRDFYDSPLLEPLLSIIRGPHFPTEVATLGGYDTSKTGQVIADL